MAHDTVSHDHRADARAAFMGLIFGAIALLVIIVGIVKLTSSRFEGHAAGSATPSAPAAQH